MPKNPRKNSKHPPRDEIEQEALNLAQLIYDIYKESSSGDTINNGQNNAQHSKD